MACCCLGRKKEESPNCSVTHVFLRAPHRRLGIPSYWQKVTDKTNKQGTNEQYSRMNERKEGRAHVQNNTHSIYEYSAAHRGTRPRFVKKSMVKESGSNNKREGDRSIRSRQLLDATINRNLALLLGGCRGERVREDGRKRRERARRGRGGGRNKDKTEAQGSASSSYETKVKKTKDVPKITREFYIIRQALEKLRLKEDARARRTKKGRTFSGVMRDEMDEEWNAQPPPLTDIALMDPKTMAKNNMSVRDIARIFQNERGYLRTADLGLILSSCGVKTNDGFLLSASKAASISSGGGDRRNSCAAVAETSHTGAVPASPASHNARLAGSKRNRQNKYLDCEKLIAWIEEIHGEVGRGEENEAEEIAIATAAAEDGEKGKQSVRRHHKQPEGSYGRKSPLMDTGILPPLHISEDVKSKQRDKMLKRTRNRSLGLRESTKEQQRLKRESLIVDAAKKSSRRRRKKRLHERRNGGAMTVRPIGSDTFRMTFLPTNRPFNTYRKFEKMNSRRLESGEYRRQGSKWPSAPKGVINAMAGPYRSDAEMRRSHERDSRKQWIGDHFVVCDHRALVAKREWTQRADNGLEHGPYVDSWRRMRDYKNDRGKYIAGDFIVS